MDETSNEIKLKSDLKKADVCLVTYEVFKLFTDYYTCNKVIVIAYSNRAANFNSSKIYNTLVILKSSEPSKIEKKDIIIYFENLQIIENSRLPIKNQNMESINEIKESIVISVSKVKDVNQLQNKKPSNEIVVGESLSEKKTKESASGVSGVSSSKSEHDYSIRLKYFPFT